MAPEIERIYQKFLERRCSREEALQLLDYFKSEAGNLDMVALIERELDRPILSDEYQPIDGFSKDAVLQRLRKQIALSAYVSRTRRMYRWVAYAAAVAAIITIGVLFSNVNQRTPESQAMLTDVGPGGNRATLTLADGRTITLNESQAGIVVGEAITYLDGTTVWNDGGAGRDQSDVDSRVVSEDGLGINSLLLMAIKTPNGGTYSITLADGTTVTLNAASQLRYPLQFNETERVVEVVGEAYFSVAKDTKRPFKVISNGQEIQVLGTQFNVSVYPDEQERKITLVEGSVRVTPTSGLLSPLTIKPGEQVILRGTEMDVRKVDTEPYTAWKDGYFYFKRTPLEEILRQAARWYDVKIDYGGNIPKESFSGEINRDVSLRGLLEILQLSTIDVKLKGKTLIVQ